MNGLLPVTDIGSTTKVLLPESAGEGPSAVEA